MFCAMTCFNQPDGDFQALKGSLSFLLLGVPFMLMLNTQGFGILCAFVRFLFGFTG